MNYMYERDWLKSRESKAMSKGRPVKIYTLSKPIAKIMDHIEQEKKEDARHRLEMVKKTEGLYPII